MEIMINRSGISCFARDRDWLYYLQMYWAPAEKVLMFPVLNKLSQAVVTMFKGRWGVLLIYMTFAPTLS